MPTELPSSYVAGADPNRPLDALFVNAPLRDYSERPRVNDFTLPVLGMGYIATYAAAAGFNVGVLDAEAQGLGIEQTAAIVNELEPRWVGMNLLAPTYEISARIAAAFDPAIKIMLGGHHQEGPGGHTKCRSRYRPSQQCADLGGVAMAGAQVDQGDCGHLWAPDTGRC